MNPRQFKNGEQLLVSEEALKRVFPGWRVPQVHWHLGTFTDDELIALPQVGTNVNVSYLKNGEVARLRIVDDIQPQYDPQARIQIREAIAYLHRLDKQHECLGQYCEHCLITKNLDDARQFLFPHDPLGDVDPESPYAGCPGK